MISDVKPHSSFESDDNRYALQLYSLVITERSQNSNPCQIRTSSIGLTVMNHIIYAYQHRQFFWFRTLCSRTIAAAKCYSSMIQKNFETCKWRSCPAHCKSALREYCVAEWLVCNWPGLHITSTLAILMRLKRRTTQQPKRKHLTFSRTSEFRDMH